jgi:N-acetylglucosamine-6-sulfatase
MNTTKSLLAKGGTTLRNFFVTTPICCPSRISYLSGRYAHNSGAIATTDAGWCSNKIFWKGPGQRVALPTYVQAAGVATGIFGKETNVNDASWISPGWDRFFVLGGSSEGHYYSDWFNDQGQRYNATAAEYMTDLIKGRAISWLTQQLAAKKRFFAYIAPHAPHVRATPAPDTEGYFWDVTSPRLPSWNRSMPDHHWMVRAQEPLTPRCISASDDLYRNRLRSLLGVDQMVGEVADIVMAHGQLDRTYFIFTADHGFHTGEMNMPYFKAQPYDTDLRVPFMIRGPGIRAGITVEAIGLNIDVAPTIAALLGTVPPQAAKVDGRSLVPILFAEDGATASPGWRKDFLFEFWSGGAQAPRGPYCHHMIAAPNNTYAGVRTLDKKYVDFSAGATNYPNAVSSEDIQEAFDLIKDKYEMKNLASKQQLTSASPPVWIATLKARLAQLRGCAEESCRT